MLKVLAEMQSILIRTVERRKERQNYFLLSYASSSLEVIVDYSIGGGRIANYPHSRTVGCDFGNEILDTRS